VAAVSGTIVQADLHFVNQGNLPAESSNIGTVPALFLWWSVVECGGVWWSVVECGGVWWSVVECGGGRVCNDVTH
jgi:hypothetical protein